VELSLIANAVPEIDRVAQQDEGIFFASSYKDLKKGLLENMNDHESDSDSLESGGVYTLLNHLPRHVRIVCHVLSSCYQSIQGVQLHMKIYMQHINHCNTKRHTALM